MFHSAVSIALVLSSLLGLSTRASAACLACSNCLEDPLPDNQGNVCLNYWTCSDNTVTCYYPSTEYPGTFSACEYTGSGSVSPQILAVDANADTELDSKAWVLSTSSPAVCATGYGVGTGSGNPKCEPPNNPYNVGTDECTSAEQYVGGTNSGLL